MNVEAIPLQVQLADRSDKKSEYWAITKTQWLLDVPIHIVRSDGWDIDVRPIGDDSRGMMLHKSLFEPVDNTVDYEKWLNKAMDREPQTLMGYDC